MRNPSAEQEFLSSPWACATCCTTDQWNRSGSFDRIQVSRSPPLLVSQQLAMKAGYAYCEPRAFQIITKFLPPNRARPLSHRSGNQRPLRSSAFAASQKSGRAWFHGATTPMTPASDILHELSHTKTLSCITPPGRTKSGSRHHPRPRRLPTDLSRLGSHYLRSGQWLP